MIRTARLLLRPWRPDDRAPFTALYAEAGIAPSDSQALLDYFTACWAEHGVCYGAVERATDGAFLGMAGLAPRQEGAPAETPACEIGWAIARAHQGHGYALEAARGWLAHAFGPLAVPDVTALVATENARLGNSETREWTYVRTDGSHVPVELSVTRRVDEDGNTVGYLFVATDETQAREVARLKDEFVGLIIILAKA